MRIAQSLILSLTIIVNSFDLSSQTSNSGPGFPRYDASNSPATHYGPGSSSGSSPAAVPPLRSRSRSPTANASPTLIMGYIPEDIRFIRLVPIKKPSSQFEIRRYTFPRDKQLEVRADNMNHQSMPTDEQTVLSTSSGDVLAIVMGNNRLRGIYVRKGDHRKRSKINMYSGVVEKMTQEEIRETPLGKSSISKYFEVLHLSRESPTQTSHPGPSVPRSGIPGEPALRTGFISPPASSSPPYILGFEYKYMKFLRLIPHANPRREFEIRRYTFPSDEQIHVRGYHNSHVSMPTVEQTVLSTGDGDVMGIVEENNRLRGFYTMKLAIQKRAKINMYSGLVEIMTTAEMQETPLPKHSTIFETFKIEWVHSTPTNMISFSRAANI